MIRRINITVDEDVLARADSFAAANRYSRSGLIAAALDAYVGATSQAAIVSGDDLDGAEVAQEPLAAYATRPPRSPLVLADVEPLLHAYFIGQADVVAAWVFGSVARGEAGPMSDIDVAVLFADELDRPARLDRAFDIRSRLTQVLRTDDVDVVSLVDASVLIGRSVARDGVAVAGRDRCEAAEALVRATTAYWEYEPVLEMQSARVAERIAEYAKSR